MNAADAASKLDNVLRGRHYSSSTRKTYGHWVRRYCQALASDQTVKAQQDSRGRVEAFLSEMAARNYSAASQNQAFNALIFFYRHVVGVELEHVNALRARRPQRIREAAEPDDTRRFLDAVQDTCGYPIRLLAHLYYESGLRLSEATRIRLKDLSFRRQQILIRDGKGGKDRMVSMPCSLVYPLQRQAAVARAMWSRDARDSLPVPLPGRLDVKYPSAPLDEAWYWLFPAHRPCEYPQGSGRLYRWHVHESTVGRALSSAAKAVGMRGRISAHVLRHSYATDMLNQGANVRQIQAELGHKHLDTTMGYLHVPAGARLWSPLEGQHVAEIQGGVK
jgi:integron integrase